MNETKEDKKEFADIIKALALQGGKEISKPLLALYFLALKDYELDDIKNIAARLLKNWEYEFGHMPSIAVMVKALDGDQPPEDRALVMSTLILDHVKRHGRNVEPDLSTDPIAKYLMTRRWPYKKWATELISSEEKWWVKEFVAAYRAHKETSVPLQIETAEPLKKLTDTVGKDL